MPISSQPRPKAFVLTNRRAAEDSRSLQASYPQVRFIASTPEEWKSVIREADSVWLGRGIPVDEVLDLAPQLTWIHSEGAGVDRTLTPKLKSSEVLLTNSAGVHGIPIAEHVLALIFAFARQLPELIHSQSRREWKRPTGSKFFELQGQTIVVVGLGGIGQVLAQKAHGVGLRVLGVRRHPSATSFGFVEKVYSIDQIDEALAQADHVAITLPLTPKTRNLFDAPRLARIREGSYIYNIGRGPIIDPEALWQALQSGRLAGAGLDVTSPEPLPASSPLWEHPRVIITNHTSAGSSKNADRTLELVRDNVGRALRGESLRNVVDKAEGY